MAHDGQDLQDIVVDRGDASSGVNNAAESPAAAAGNGNHNGEHLVDAEEFKNVRLAIGTLGKNISVSDNLTGTRHIDIRVRRNNRQQSGGGVAAGQAVVGPGNEAPQEQAPPPDSAAAAQTNRRLKITVAADEPKPKPKPKPDADVRVAGG